MMTVQAQPVEKSALARQAIVWVVSVAIAAMVGAKIDHWWKRPKPVVELARVGLGDPLPADEEIMLPYPLLLMSQVNPFFPDIAEPRQNAASLRSRLTEAATTEEMIVHSIATVDAARKLLSTQSAQVSSDLRRVEFLRCWSDSLSGGGFLDANLKILLHSHDNELPRHYQKHDKKWPKLITFTDKQGVLHQTWLTELDEEEHARVQASIKGPVNVYDQTKVDCHLTNLLRRLFGYYEPDVLLPLLAELRDLLQTQLDATKDIAVQVESIMTQHSRQRLTVSAAVYNQGGRSVAILSRGILTLMLPSTDPSSGIQVSIEMMPEDSSERVLVVNPHSARAVKLSSVKSVPELLAENRNTLGGKEWVSSSRIEDSRLVHLFEGQGVEAYLSLARAGVSSQKSPIQQSKRILVGQAAESDVLMALSKDR